MVLSFRMFIFAVSLCRGTALNSEQLGAVSLSKSTAPLVGDYVEYKSLLSWRLPVQALVEVNSSVNFGKASYILNIIDFM